MTLMQLQSSVQNLLNFQEPNRNIRPKESLDKKGTNFKQVLTSSKFLRKWIFAQPITCT